MVKALASLKSLFKGWLKKECRVRVSYTGLLRRITKTGQEEVALPTGATPLDLLHRLAAQYGEAFREQVWDQQGGLRSTVLVFVDEVEVPAGRLGEVPLSGTNVSLVVLLQPMEGGSEPSGKTWCFR